MSVKLAEDHFGAMARAFPTQAPSGVTKHADRRTCHRCHTLLGKSENTSIDYSWSPWGKFLVEVKEDQKDHGGYRLRVSDITRDQRDELAAAGDYAFLFLEMKDPSVKVPRPPKRRKAYLIPWAAYTEVEISMIAKGVRSFTLLPGQKQLGTDILFADFALVWEAGKWTIPLNHIFHGMLKQATLEIVKGWGYEVDL